MGPIAVPQIYNALLPHMSPHLNYPNVHPNYAAVVQVLDFLFCRHLPPSGLHFLLC